MEQTENQNEKKYTIGTFAKLTGVTERTLRFYDRKGLLKPTMKNQYGHRYYSEQDIYQLQKILVLKYLDFSLEEIEQYLFQHNEDFRSTLNSQYSLLLRKQKQLQQVIDAIEHMQHILKDTDKLDINLLVMLIYSLQNEQKQKEWLVGLLPKSFVDVIFMEGKSKEDRQMIEGEIIEVLMELKRFYKESRSPLDVEVILAGKRMVAVYERIIGSVLETLSEDELAMIEGLDEEQNELDPVLFPQMFSPEEEAFLKEVFAEISLIANKKLEKGDGGNEQKT